MLQRGVTLIELLVVLVIIGLFASLVMLTVTPNENRAVEREAKRLMQVIQLAQDEAVMQGVNLGLAVQPSKYSFSRLQDNQWLPLTADREFSEHNLDAAVAVYLQIDGELVLQSINDVVAPPAVMILSSGELSNFTLSVSKANQAGSEFQITGREDGQLSLQTVKN